MTTQIELIDRDVCDQILSVVLDEMKRTLKDYNIDIKRKRATYTKNNIQAKFEFSLISNKGEVLNKHVTDFPLYAHRYGLEPKDLGKEFKDKNETYKITGLNTSAHKYPICVTSMFDGKKYKFPESIVKNALYGKTEYNIKQIN